MLRIGVIAALFVVSLGGSFYSSSSMVRGFSPNSHHDQLSCILIKNKLLRRPSWSCSSASKVRSSRVTSTTTRMAAASAANDDDDEEEDLSSSLSSGRDRLLDDIHDAVAEFNTWPTPDKIQGLQDLFESMSSGDVDRVPEPLQNLLMVRPATEQDDNTFNGAYISWVPSILQQVLRYIELDDHGNNNHWLDQARHDMLYLLERFVGPDEPRGGISGTEILFDMAMMARAIARRGDGDGHSRFANHRFSIAMSFQSIVRDDAERDAMIVTLNPFDKHKAGRRMHECETWDEFVKGMTALDASKPPTFAIFLPKNEKLFGVYNVMTIYSVNGEIVDCRGYSFAIDPADVSTKPICPDRIKPSYLLTCLPPLEESYVDKNGWYICSKPVIDKFYGESGRYWTPEMFKKIADTMQKRDE